MKKKSVLFFVLGFSSFISFAQAAGAGAGTPTQTIYVECPVSGNTLDISSPELTTFTAEDKDYGSITVVKFNNSSHRAGIPLITVSYGWGLYGNCWEYGTFYTIGNQTLFTPCGGNCVGFPAICPEAGNVMCRLPFTVNAEP